MTCERRFRRGAALWLLILCLLVGIVVIVALWPQGRAVNPRLKRFSIVITGFSRGNLDPWVKRYSLRRKRSFGGMLHTAGLVRKVLEEETEAGYEPVLVDLGDHLSGSAEAFHTQGAIVTAIMNTLPYRAALLGNREFNHGQAVLAQRVKEARFPYLATNLKDAKGELPSFASPSTVVAAAGLKIGFVGYVPPDLETLCLEEHVQGLTADRKLVALETEAERLRKEKGVDLVVALSQADLGYKVGWLVYGLKGSRLNMLLGLNYRRNGGMVTFHETLTYGLRSNNRGAQVLTVRVEWDPDLRRIVRTRGDGRLCNVETNAKDERAVAVSAPFLAQVKAALARPVGKLDGELGDPSYHEESPLGNLVVDAMRDAVKADVAWLNSGSLGTGLNAGVVTEGDLFRLYPFENSIVLLQATGRDIEEALRSRIAEGFFYQVSGMSYAYRRVGKWKGELISLQVDGDPIDPSAVYRLAVNSFAYQRINRFHGAKVLSRAEKVRLVLQEHLRKHKSLTLHGEGRITVLPEAEASKE